MFEQIDIGMLYLYLDVYLWKKLTTFGSISSKSFIIENWHGSKYASQLQRF